MRSTLVQRRGSSVSRRGRGPSRRVGLAVLLLGALAALAGCVPLSTANDLLVGRDGYVQWRGIAYGSDPRQVLDVYASEAVARTQAPAAGVVVFFYGGAWRSGSRDYYRFVGKALADAGFVVVIPDYRLSPAVRFPAFNEDGAAAVRWARDHIAGYGGDADAIVLIGHSAGAHIAALLVTDRHYLQQAGVPAAAIRGFVGLAGPYAINPLDYRVSRPAFAGAEPEAATQPINHVTGGEPPLLLLHGADDRTVWPLNSHAFADRVNAAGGSAEVIEYADVGHVGLLLAFADFFRGEGGPLADAVRFVSARLPARGPATPTVAALLSANAGDGR